MVFLSFLKYKLVFYITSVFSFYYRPQRSWAKVMFLQASVILLTGGGVYTPQDQTPPGADTPRTRPPRADTPPQSRHPQNQTPPPEQTPPWTRPPRVDPPREQTPPPGSTLQHTVNERPVRILLECILVFRLLEKKMNEQKMMS